MPKTQYSDTMKMMTDKLDASTKQYISLANEAADKGTYDSNQSLTLMAQIMDQLNVIKSLCKISSGQ